jgi:short-subunit dehydrogenase
VVGRIGLVGRKALVTGASSGIGLWIARELAKRGAHLGLMARRTDRLQSLADELRAEHKVKAISIPADLSDANEIPRAVERATAAMGQVDVLVNNAGLGQYGDFVGDDPDRIQTLLAVNVVALTRLTRAFVGPMVDRRFGVVINIASLAGCQPTPHMAVYGASKAYVVSFSQALRQELKGKGVCVTCVCPGYTATEFFSHGGYDRQASRPMDHAMSAERVAREAVEAAVRRKILIVPGLKNRLLSMLSRFLTRRQVLYVSHKVLAQRQAE